MLLFASLQRKLKEVVHDRPRDANVHSSSHVNFDAGSHEWTHLPPIFDCDTALDTVLDDRGVIYHPQPIPRGVGVENTIIFKSGMEHIVLVVVDEREKVVDVSNGRKNIVARPKRPSGRDKFVRVKLAIVFFSFSRDAGESLS